MNITEQELKKELSMLYQTEKELKEQLKKAPKGNLRVSNSHTKPEYYYKQEGVSGKNGSYIKKKDLWKAKAIAQRDYNVKMLVCIERRIALIEKFMEWYGRTKPEDVFDMLNFCRKELVSPVIVSDEEYIKQWLKTEYQGKGFVEGASSFITERGERVRSKSEKIIADKLYTMGIPYRYEYPITLSNGIRVYPDFTILKMPDRKEIYLEHFGLLDDETYLESTLRKLNSYSENGIILGDNLLITYESSHYPLNTKMLDGVLKRMRVV